MRSGEIAAKTIIDKNYNYDQDVRSLLENKGSMVYPIGGNTWNMLTNEFLSATKTSKIAAILGQKIASGLDPLLTRWFVRYIRNRYMKIIGCPLPGIEVTVEKVR